MRLKIVAKLNIIQKLENYDIAAKCKLGDPVLQFLTTTEIAGKVVLAQKRKHSIAERARLRLRFVLICTIIMHPCIITKSRYALICLIIMHLGS